ncbi:LysR family transcriptional regulator [Pelagibacterium sp. 26DY04]|uniref:LysR family transcriptional regulator n=1 Tax=Pelagibacterium sp. 26DY04 TaxID=2967130 RepID=UPI002814F444|nr:LysR family transcriptional regulator [Pelagibacterium sp. 26DY04]WMT86560.1 LysR family transcriptional regulator [Pelagibacterium sp. 26DY04]
MDRDLLPHLSVVASVARRGGFAAAARELSMSASAVSHAVRLVEERLGQPLFARTTRSVALTEAGKSFMATIAPALGEIDEQIERLRGVKGRASGLLRINAARVSLPLALTPVIAAMAERYPDVEVELFSDERLADIVAEGFDAGIRVGEMLAQDMVAIRLTPPFKSVVFASPDYIGRHGRPQTLDELAKHNCIGYRLIRSSGLYRWEFNLDGREVAVAVKGSAIVTESHSAIELALAGVGLGYAFEPLVRADIAAGRLVQVLDQFAVDEAGLFLYFPRRASLAPKLRAFIDTTREVMRAGAF